MRSSDATRPDRPSGSRRPPAPSLDTGRRFDDRQAPADVDRAVVANQVVEAADRGTLDPDEAGRLVSLICRAATRGELHQITDRLDELGQAARSAALRRRQLRLLALLAVCVLVSVLLVVGLLYGLGPVDPR